MALLYSFKWPLKGTHQGRPPRFQACPMAPRSPRNESDESIYWMELLAEMRVMLDPSLQKIMEEAHQILSIIVASIKTARSSNRQS
jgi:hypothetical protein